MALNLFFQNGTVVDATQLNALVLQCNNNEIAINNLQATINAISKSQLLLLASKSTQQTLTSTGQNNIITNWSTQLNVGSIFNQNTGIAIAPINGTYTLEVKTIVSADNAVSPRSKLVIYAGGNPVGVSEDTTFQESPATISNYRNSHYANATVPLNQGVPINAVVQVWGASTARIFADINTIFKIWLEI